MSALDFADDDEAGRGSARARNERRILEAAEQVFARLGFKGATTAEIAAEAGLPKANLHYYFPTKEALYRRVMENLIEIWLDAGAPLDETDDPREALARYIGAKMDLARAHPHGSKVFASEIMRGAPIIRDHIEGRLAQWVREHGLIVRRWIKQGRLRPIEPKTLFFLIWAATQHYADFDAQIALLNSGQALSDRQFAKARAQVIAIIVDGALAPARRPSRTQPSDDTDS